MKTRILDSVLSAIFTSLIINNVFSASVSFLDPLKWGIEMEHLPEMI